MKRSILSWNFGLASSISRESGFIMLVIILNAKSKLSRSPSVNIADFIMKKLQKSLFYLWKSLILLDHSGRQLLMTLLMKSSQERL